MIPSVFIPVILQVACALAALLGTLTCTSPRWGRCQQRSNLPLAELSVTRITYLCKLIGTPSLAACLKLELFRVYCCVANKMNIADKTNSECRRLSGVCQTSGTSVIA
ncbi:hypothetical protein D5073_10830 [Pectobacterium versatile]|nr:hypothetical protein D5073_10830 [Pectobacterium versatile]RJL57618.1 hypothetical protein D5076_13040 [Pectobacterium versatile]RJL60168.1 hypothetical protein D5080_16785 [Pectobacterium versatile]